MADSRTTKSHYQDLADIIRQKKNTVGETYTPQEIVDQVKSLTGPSGKSVIFRNLDSSGGQHFEVRLTPYGGDSFSQTTDGGDLTIKAQLPVASYWMRAHAGYVPGEFDIKPPLNMNDIEEDTIVTAETGYLQSSLPEKELVDMSNYYSKNKDCISNGRFTDTAKSYFKTIKPTSLSNAFYQANYAIDAYPLLLLDTSECTTMKYCFYYMFRNTSSKLILNLSSWDTINVISMSSMFDGCSSLTSLDVSSFDTSNVSSMQYMFSGCSSLTILDLSSFDTSKVSSMSGMFNTCNSLTSLDLSSFDTSSVDDMSFMFRGCKSLTILDLSSFNTSKVSSMTYMFDGCSSLTSLDLSSFNTSKVYNMSSMFNGCSSLTTLDLSSFTFKDVNLNKENMFNGCTKLTEIKGVIDFHNQSSNSIYYRDMFTGCPISSSTPVQIKNPPTAENWWQTAGFTSEDQFEIVQ